MAELTDSQVQFLEMCEKEFTKRYTCEDKAFMQVEYYSLKTLWGAFFLSFLLYLNIDVKSS